ncbi:MAG: hypothetical protein PXZ08_04730 [Actinomycetota bacterium]|jgi:hypothetical protein|nr:hypothetical protein [Actinomycetota bacterium]
MTTPTRLRRTSIVAVVIFYVVATIVARRRGYSGLGGRTLVRCFEGHLFRTLWIPGVSLKSIRLGWYRFQFCPVGRHWTMVKPVRESDVADEIGAMDLLARDLAVP